MFPCHLYLFRFWVDYGIGNISNYYAKYLKTDRCFLVTLNLLNESWVVYSMTSNKGPTLFLSSLSDRVMFKFGMHKENSLN